MQVVNLAPRDKKSIMLTFAMIDVDKTKEPFSIACKPSDTMYDLMNYVTLYLDVSHIKIWVLSDWDGAMKKTT
eukprot:1201817-Karenia_brevis.AAC.1